MQRRFALVFALVVISVMALTTVAIAADKNVGTWKLNLAKSKYSPGPAPKSQTLKIEAWGDDGVKYTADGSRCGRQDANRDPDAHECPGPGP